MKKYLLLFFILIAYLPLFSDNIEFIAEAKQTVSTGEQFALVYTINAQGSNFRAPALRDFNMLSGPSTSSSTSVQWINGQMSQSVTISYTYILQAVKEGTFTIAPASITIGGKTYNSNQLKITVVKGSAPQQSQQQQRQNQNQQAQPGQTTQDIANDDIFIRTIINKTSVYKGEAILIIQKLYTRINIAGIEDIKMPSYTGFWTEDIKLPQQIQQKRENYNGSTYMVGELKKTIIIPQKTGKLEIEAPEIGCIVQVRAARRSQSIWDDFFGPQVQNVKYKVKGKRLSIDVKPLPIQNQPADFNDAVGSFTLKSDLDKTQSKTNEPITLKISISGSGNIKLIDKLDIDFPSDFETYDPKITTDLNTNEGGISGVKKFEYLLIPRAAGTFKIKALRFSYFDINTKAYKTLTTPEYIINIAKGEGATENVTYSSVKQEDVKFIGSDIRFIKNQPFLLVKTGNRFFLSKLFNILLLAPVLLFILFVIIWRRAIKQRSNIALMRNKRATGIAKKRLSEAAKQMKQNNKDIFYEEISKALWGYIGDKFNIPLSDLSLDIVSNILKQKNIKVDIINQINDILNNCEYARFAPADSSNTMNNIYNEAISIISLIEKEL